MYLRTQNRTQYCNRNFHLDTSNNALTWERVGGKETKGMVFKTVRRIEKQGPRAYFRSTNELYTSYYNRIFPYLLKFHREGIVGERTIRLKHCGHVLWLYTVRKRMPNRKFCLPLINMNSRFNFKRTHLQMTSCSLFARGKWALSRNIRMRIHPELLSTVKHLASELVYYMKKKQCFFSNFSLCVWIRLLLDSDSENVNTRPLVREQFILFLDRLIFRSLTRMNKNSNIY